MVLNFQRPIQVAITLAIGLLVLRTWLMLGLVAPVQVMGDSMAGTLLGPHQAFTCQTCGHPFPVGAERMRTDRMAVCPLCRQATGLTDESNLSSGQHLLIDRTAFQFRRPRRWEVVVFRCPERAVDLCVKRVVGLPGERVQIRDGDIYVNGQICRKDLIRQRAVRQLVDKTFSDHWPSSWRPSRWTAQPSTTPRSTTGWRSDGDRFVFKPPAVHKSPSETDWLTYCHDAHCHNDGQPIRDDAAANQNVTRRLNPVADVMLSCRVQIERRATHPPGRLLLSATDFRESFEVQITPALHEICLYCNGQIVWRAKLDSDPFRRPTQIELSLFDRQLLLAIDGRTCLTYPYQASDRPSRPTSRPLAIGVQNLALSVDRLSVWRDVYYGPFPSGGAGHGLSSPYQTGPDQFFVLGDNSPISLDSRTWQTPGLAAKFLVGKPLGVQ